MSSDADWFVPLGLGGAPQADDRWTWSEVTCLPAAAKRRPPKGHRAIVHVMCPGTDCGSLVGRVDVSPDDEHTFVTWLGGAQEGVSQVLS